MDFYLKQSTTTATQWYHCEPITTSPGKYTFFIIEQANLPQPIQDWITRDDRVKTFIGVNDTIVTTLHLKSHYLLSCCQRATTAPWPFSDTTDHLTGETSGELNLNNTQAIPSQKFCY